MGVWLGGSFFGNWLSGVIGTLYSKAWVGRERFFLMLTAMGLLTGIATTLLAAMRYAGQGYEIDVPLERDAVSAGDRERVEVAEQIEHQGLAVRRDVERHPRALVRREGHGLGGRQVEAGVLLRLVLLGLVLLRVRLRGNRSRGLGALVQVRRRPGAGDRAGGSVRTWASARHQYDGGHDEGDREERTSESGAHANSLAGMCG